MKRQETTLISYPPDTPLLKVWQLEASSTFRLLAELHGCYLSWWSLAPNPKHRLFQNRSSRFLRVLSCSLRLVGSSSNWNRKCQWLIPLFIHFDPFIAEVCRSNPSQCQADHPELSRKLQRPIVIISRCWLLMSSDPWPACPHQITCSHGLIPTPPVTPNAVLQNDAPPAHLQCAGAGTPQQLPLPSCFDTACPEEKDELNAWTGNAMKFNWEPGILWNLDIHWYPVVDTCWYHVACFIVLICNGILDLWHKNPVVLRVPSIASACNVERSNYMETPQATLHTWQSYAAKVRKQLETGNEDRKWMAFCCVQRMDKMSPTDVYRWHI